METETETRSPVLRFFDSFLKERSIQWILGTGVLILLGSSIALVTAHWQESTPLWKYLVLLGYTAAAFASGRLSYHRLGLRRTGTVLHALTVLMLPITFLALDRVGSEEGFPARALHLVLLAGNLAFAAFAARRVFQHFLRVPQIEFTASYLILCAAGALAPGLSPGWSIPAALFLWAVLTAGVIKVNRHVFWLVEERRAPRIFGFFPTILLGLQFLIHFGLYLAPAIPAQWMGLGCVLLATPILMSADALARVFQARTGDLIRPLPRSVVIPLAAGLILCAGGLCLSGSGIFEEGKPFALAPTAAITAVLLVLVARRTSKEAFLWAALFAVTMAYNFSPFYFREIARRAVNLGAQAVQEEALPHAFYGLTYIPLLLVLSGIAGFARRRGQDFYARPLRRFSTSLTALLLALSLTHEKAIFPVGICLAATFGLEAVLFSDRRILLLGILAFVQSAIGAAPFASRVLGWSLPPDFTLMALTVVAAIFLAPGFLLDKKARSLEVSRSWEGNPGLSILMDSPFQASSLALAVFACGLWIGRQAVEGPAGWLLAGLLSALLAAHALRWLLPGLGEAAIFFLGTAGAIYGDALGASAGDLVSAGTFFLAVIWCSSRILERRPGLRISRAFARGAHRVSLAGSCLVLGAVLLPLAAFEALGVEAQGFPPVLAWPCRILVLAWAFDAARRTAGPWLGALGCLGVLGTAGSALVAIAGAGGRPWLPALWSLLALAALPIVSLLEGRTARMGREAGEVKAPSSSRALLLPIRHAAWIVPALVGTATLGALTWPQRTAGLLAAGALFLFGLREKKALPRRLSLVLLNWQVLVSILQVLCGGAPQFLHDLTLAAFLPAALPLAAAAAASVLLGKLFPRADPSAEREILLAHRIFLRTLAALSIAATLSLETLAPFQVLAAPLAFASLAFVEFLSACREKDAARVWTGEVLIGTIVGYLAWFGLIPFGHGTSLYVILASGLLAWTASRMALLRPSTAILSEPLGRTAMAMPLACAAVGLGQFLSGTRASWLGGRSLAMLLAAGVYFSRGLEGRSRRLLLLSAGIFNAALSVLWSELAWSDPQCFLIPLGASILILVELLKEEIPGKLQDPLRYLGALVILVSPTFHIVEGSWVHLLTLMIASVAVVLAAIGARVRALLYAGTAFLAADLVAMVVRGSLDVPSLPWIAGLVLGAAVITLGAVCENHRETLLQRLRGMAALLERWQ